MTDENEDRDNPIQNDSEEEIPESSHELRTDGGETIVADPSGSPSVGSPPFQSAGPGGPTNQIPSGERDTKQTSTEELLQEVLEERQDWLEPITPDEAVELYLDDRARECARSTINAHRSRLGFFVDWCSDRGIANCNDISARDLHDFRAWRRRDLNVVTERTQMVTLRVFIQWCETIDAVETGLSQKITIPSIDDCGARDTVLSPERGRRILEYLESFEYATIEHVCWVILTETGMRLGSAQALDIDDYRPGGDSAYLNVCHRPVSETPIKKGKRGERPVGISDEVCAILDDYLKHQRPDVTDEYGREPLLATSYGRVAKSTLRKYVYKWSRPCKVGQGCPHDRSIQECKAAGNLDHAAKCPSSVTPHPIRRGYITLLLRTGVSVDVVSSRCDVTSDIIEQHYNVRSKEDKMRQRQQILNEVTGGDSPYS